LAKRALVVPSGLVAVPATVKSFSVMLLPLKSCLSSLKLMQFFAACLNYSRLWYIGQPFFATMWTLFAQIIGPILLRIFE
jgi:hypothetical protein